MDNADPIDIKVGIRIRIRRKQLKISQSALAEHLGVTFQQVQKYERGANRISASMLVRAAQKLDVSVAELVGEARDAVADDEVLGILAGAGALELLRAFSAVNHPKTRMAILELVRATAEGDQKRPAIARNGRIA